MKYTNVIALLVTSIVSSAFAAKNTVSVKSSFIPSFSKTEFDNYVISKNYSELPSFVGFSPVLNVSGQVVKHDTLDDGETIPIQVVCGVAMGCENYDIQLISSGSFGLLYKEYATDENSNRVDNYASFLTWDNSIVKSVVFLPSTSPVEIVDSTYPPTLKPVQIDKPQETFRGFKKTYGELIAVLYLDTNKLKTLGNLPLRWVGTEPLSWGNGPRRLTQSFDEVQKKWGQKIETPFLIEGSLWKLVDSSLIAPRITWSFSSSISTGVTNSKSTEHSVTAGVKATAGSDVTPVKVTVETYYNWDSGWKQTWSNANVQETTLTCDNSLNPLPKICALYQLQAAVIFVAPGLTANKDHDGIFDEFNTDPESHGIILNVGEQDIKGKSFIFKDEKYSVSSIFPYAGTKADENANLMTTVMLTYSPK